MSFFVERNIRTERLEITMITVNAMGDTCPIPVVKTKNAIKELNGAGVDRKSTRLNSSHVSESRMPSSA